MLWYGTRVEPNPKKEINSRKGNLCSISLTLRRSSGSPASSARAALPFCGGGGHADWVDGEAQDRRLPM